MVDGAELSAARDHAAADAMYHSWGSQNAWLRQITARTALYVPRPRGEPGLGRRLGLVPPISAEIRVPGAADGRGEPAHGLDLERHRQAQGRLGARQGCAGGTRGFLLNHLISELLPPKGGGYRYSNSDPITGQAAWFDLRVSIARPMARERGAAVRGAGPGPVCPAPANVAFGKAGWNAHDQPSGNHEKKLGLVIDLDTCVGCHACAVLQGMEHRRLFRAAQRSRRLWRGPLRRLAQPCPQLRGGDRRTHRRRSCISRGPACIARSPPASPSARPAPATSAPRTGSCWSTRTPASAASCVPGPAPTARANGPDDGVMKKCTLCVDRIYNDTCPRKTGTRLRAGLPDRRAAFRRSRRSRQSVSRLVAERGGFDLMPEWLQAGQQVPAAPTRPAGLAVLDLSSRASGTGLAGAEPVALELAVARRASRRSRRSSCSVFMSLIWLVTGVRLPALLGLLSALGAAQPCSRPR
jgi:Fe-S-cluster-containing dehydrogenase component